MFKIIVLAAVIGCTLAAPAPYDSPPKSGVLQEISKYHVTAQNKEQFATSSVATPVKPVAHEAAAVPAPVSEKTIDTKPIEGPTPAPIAVKPAVHVNKREATHTDEHKEEPKNVEPIKKEDEKTAKPSDFVRTPENDKKATVKRESESKPQEAGAKVPTEHKCDSTTCTQAHTHPHPQRETTVTSGYFKQVEVKNVPEGSTTSKAIVKREDVTTKATPTATTPAQRHLAPTAVHSSFSQTWTRPQAAAVNPAPASQTATAPHPAAALQHDDKVPAASDSKPVIASIDPLKPHEEAKTTSTTTVAPSTTRAAGRSRRGIDETESQEQPKEPKPTRAWWRSMDLNKKEEPKKDAAPVAAKDEKKTAPVVPAVAAKKEKRESPVVQKVEEKRPSTGVHVTSTQKAPVVEKDEKKTAPVVPAVAAKKEKRESPAEKEEEKHQQPIGLHTTTTKPSAPEYDSKPPQFVHPVPVEQVLGQKPVEIKHHVKTDDEKKTEEKKESEDKHEASHQAHPKEN